MWKEELQAVVW